MRRVERATMKSWSMANLLLYVSLAFLYFPAPADTTTEEFPLGEYIFGKPKDGLQLNVPVFMKAQIMCYYRHPTCCSCEADCMKYKHCCLDYLWSTYFTKTPTPTIKEYLHLLVSEASKYKDTICLPVTRLPGTGHQAILMVATCPTNTPTESPDKKLCEDDSILGLQSISPVLGNDSYIYKNMYCARCHGNNNFRTMNISVSCKYFNSSLVVPDDPASVLRALTDCFGMIHSNFAISETIKKCNFFDYFSVPTRSSANYSDASELCRSYTGRMSIANLSHKNYDCASPAIEKKNLFSVDQCHSSSSLTPLRYSLVISYQKDVDISLSDRYQTSPVYTNRKVCGKNQRYDIFTSKCEKFSCGSGYVEKDGECIFVGIDQRYLDANAALKQCVAAHRGGLYVSSKQNSSFIRHILLETLRNNSVKLHAPSTVEVQSTSDVRTVYFLGQFNTSSDINKAISTFDSQKSMFKLISDVVISSADRLVTIRKIFRPEVIFPNKKLCAKPRAINVRVANVTADCSLSVGNHTYSSSNYSVSLFMNSTSSNVVQVHVCDGFYLSSCDKHWAEITYYTLMPKLAIQTRSGKVYQSHEYAPTKDGVVVCIDFPTTPTPVPQWKLTVDDIESYITVLGIVFSMIGYLLVIGTFVYFKELRTVPGKNIVCLCVALLSADVVLLTQIAAVKNKGACEGVAIIFHYFLLASHAWAVAITYDITHTFLGKSLNRDARSTKRFMWYFAIAWSVPCVIVLICVFLDISGTVRLGYGKFNGACWIEKVAARLIVYIIPSLLSILYCLIALVLTLYKIHKQRKETANILQSRQNQTQSLAKMALKLVILLGVIEIIGLVQGVDSSSDSAKKFYAAIQLLFAFLRSFRGVLICIFYVMLNKTVIAAYKLTSLFKHSASTAVPHTKSTSHTETST